LEHRARNMIVEAYQLRKLADKLEAAIDEDERISP
jgi:hypothetical protein